MASAQTHRDKAQENEAFALEIEAGTPKRPDWALTLLFYAAVHEVLAFLVDNRAICETYGEFPKRHSERIALLDTHTPWRPLAALYKDFLIWSSKARYDLWPPGDNDLQLAKVQLRFIRDFIAAA